MQAGTPQGCGVMPPLMEPRDDLPGTPAALLAWIALRRDALEERLLQSGALLLRGFAIHNARIFRDVVAAIRPGLRTYAGGDSPRTPVGDRVYTSTEFPPHMHIGLHNELSYTRTWPERVFFCCLAVAQSGGETPIADGRRAYSLMDPEVRRRFSQAGVIYRQHLRDHDVPGPGKSWQETFDTEARAQAENICRAQGLEFDWTRRGLRTSLRNPGVLQHPVTGETCWFNQADLWHARFDNVKAQEQGASPEASADEALGSHACYGDGAEIPTTDLEAVRAAYAESELAFPWQAGDLLILDNLLAMHGRRPFSGSRSVLVAMA